MDEQLDFFSPRSVRAKERRATLGLMLGAGLVVMPGLSAGCRMTEVALVNVSNETDARLHVRSRLRGYADFEDTFDLAPAEERPLIKYEENRSSVEPIANLVLALQLVTVSGCVAQLTDGGLAGASTRATDRRHWTVHLRPEALVAARCAPDAMSPATISGPRATAGPSANPAMGDVAPSNHASPAPADENHLDRP